MHMKTVSANHPVAKLMTTIIAALNASGATPDVVLDALLNAYLVSTRHFGQQQEVALILKAVSEQLIVERSPAALAGTVAH